MFDKENAFRGKHCDMVIKLTGEFLSSSEDGSSQKKHSLFKTNFDVYLLAPIIGFLYRRKADVDTTPNGGTTKIFADIQMKNSDDLNFNYRLIMLLDKENESDSEKRIEKAFRGIKNENDELLYNQYVLGGVEVLYENIIEKSSDYIVNLYDFLDDFNSRYNEDLDLEKILAMARKTSF